MKKEEKIVANARGVWAATKKKSAIERIDNVIEAICDYDNKKKEVLWECFHKAHMKEANRYKGASKEERYKDRYEFTAEQFDEVLSATEPTAVETISMLVYLACCKDGILYRKVGKCL
jgi:hypothetical protein